MTWVAGVDGCRGGWVVILMEMQSTGRSAWELRLCSSFGEVLDLDLKPAAIAIDIPIGLLDSAQSGGRDCDRAARSLLGRRASSVFSPPIRKFLYAKSYEKVQGMSRQAFGILKKIREVDGLMNPQRQSVVYEAHPELAFFSLAGHPMRFNKKKVVGREERLQVLERVPNNMVRECAKYLRNDLTGFTRGQVAPDDLLDACVLAWTAQGVVKNKALRVPASPPVDRKGLRMEIWY